MEQQIDSLVWGVGATLFFLGVAVGLAFGIHNDRQIRRKEDSERELEQVNKDLANYQNQVKHHFVEMARVVNQFSAGYQAVYEHFVHGAQVLGGEQLNKLLQFDTHPTEINGAPLIPSLVPLHPEQINQGTLPTDQNQDQVEADVQNHNMRTSHTKLTLVENLQPDLGTDVTDHSPTNTDYVTVTTPPSPTEETVTAKHKPEIKLDGNKERTQEKRRTRRVNPDIQPEKNTTGAKTSDSNLEDFSKETRILTHNQ